LCSASSISHAACQPGAFIDTKPFIDTKKPQNFPAPSAPILIQKTPKNRILDTENPNSGKIRGNKLKDNMG